jgi:hypothetical protein
MTWNSCIRLGEPIFHSETVLFVKLNEFTTYLLDSSNLFGNLPTSQPSLPFFFSSVLSIGCSENTASSCIYNYKKKSETKAANLGPRTKKNSFFTAPFPRPEAVPAFQLQPTYHPSASTPPQFSL